MAIAFTNQEEITMASEPTRIAISEFKATCLKLLEQVKRTGCPVLVTKRGEPMALVVPPPASQVHPSWLGLGAKTGRIVGDIVSPVVADEEWEAAAP
jgi:prevent-host-death family protein